MGRRILAAIVALTTLAVAAFGVPLALSVRDQYRKEAVLRLDREATRAALGVPADFGSSGEPVELPDPGGGVEVGLYGPDGRLVRGRGPARPDQAVGAALAGRISQAGEADGPVIAVPVIANEAVTGVLRAAQPESDIEGRVHRAWLVMLALGLGAVSLAAVIGLGVSRRISRPVHTIAGAAERLGHGDFSARVDRFGIGELDTLGAALNATAERLGELLRRERAFSADASHQLRTPIAALRLRLEAAQLDPEPDQRPALENALADLDRLETTVMARTLAEAEGARLFVGRASPHPLFSVVLPSREGDR